MTLVSSSISMVEGTTSTWTTPQTSSCSHIEGQMSSCAIEETGAGAMSRSRCSSADTYCFKTFVRRSNRAQHTSIERHGTSSVTTQWAVCAVAMKLTEERTTVLKPYFYTRGERLDRATKGADPRTEQTTTRGPTGGVTTSEKLMKK